MGIVPGIPACVGAKALFRVMHAARQGLFTVHANCRRSCLYTRSVAIGFNRIFRQAKRLSNLAVALAILSHMVQQFFFR
jgi:hypothetical protein